MRDPRDLARTAAAAGAHVLRARAGDLGAVRVKGSATDLVTEVDIAAGIATVRALLAERPSANIIVEEVEVYEALGITPGSIDDSEVWLVDPLDGTTSFVHGFPCYSVSVALVREGQPVAGAVFNAALGDEFSAAVGAGADRDGTPISLGRAAPLNEALMVTGFPYDRGEPLDRQLRVLAAFLRLPVHGIRRDGSAAIDCCHVAGGRADGFWEYGLQPWDCAAGALICREAGARATDITGEEWSVRSSGIIAAHPELHAQMLEVIRAAEAGIV